MLHQVIPPSLRIHLIMGNGSSHASAATRAWMAAHPRFAVTCTPRQPSWLNIVEQCPAQQERRPLQVELRRRR